jgi:hypothetical protein
MRVASLCLVVSIISLAVPSAHARDTEYQLKIDDVLQSAEYRSKLGDSVRFYFGNQPVPHVAKTFGEFVTNKKTNSLGKPDEEAYRWGDAVGADRAAGSGGENGRQYDN